MKNIEKMLISEKNAELRARETAGLLKAQERHAKISEVLDVIPEGSPAPLSINDFGYCADVSLTFARKDTTVPALLALYPPFECIDLQDGSQSQKPQKYLRENELTGAILVIYPVVIKNSRNESTARWWTRIGQLNAEISVNDVTTDDIVPLLEDKYDARSHQYSTGSCQFFVRKLSDPVTQPAALVLWAEQWVQAWEKSNCTAVQIRFLKELREALVSETFKFKEKVELVEFHLHWYKGIDHLQDSFTTMFPDESVVSSLSSFVQSMVDQMPAAQAKTEEQFATVQRWFDSFFSSHGYLLDNDTDVGERIRHKLRHDTKLDVTVRSLRGSRYNISVSAYFKGVNKYPDWRFIVPDSARRIKPQDIDVTYM
jgi:hypothetical protein